MAYTTGTVTGHYALVDEIRSFTAAQGWVELEVDTASANRLLWWKAPGLSGTEEIFLGLRTYQSVALDYYNLSVFAAIGYVPGNTYLTQPGFSGAKGVPLWNQPITYWMTCNGQRLIVACKVQNVYTSFYIGKFSPYAPPSQYPYPVTAGGMLTDEAATRYSDTSYSSWFKGGHTRCLFRFVDGVWKNATHWPYYMGIAPRNTNAHPDTADGHYGVYPILVRDDNNIYGELDGVFMCSGFNNATENLLTVDSIQYLVVRDVWRTGISDYMALRLN